MNKKRIYFHILGIAIVSFWLLMTGILIQRTLFGMSGAAPGADISTAGITSAQRDWREIYLKDSKVGYAVSMIKPFDEGYFIQEDIFLRLNLMGLGKGLYTMTQSRVDKDFLLKGFHFSMNSGTVHYSVKGRVEGNVLVIETGRKDQKRVSKMTLSRPPMMGAGMGYFFRNRALRVGETFKLPLFDPSTMAHKEAFIRVAGRESIDIYGLRYHAYRLETELWGKPLIFWLDEEGDILKETGFMGLTTVKSNAARAPQDIAGDKSGDLYEMTAVGVAKTIPRPDRLGALKLRIGGTEQARFDTRFLNDHRQKYHDGVLEITREKPPFKAAYRLPHEGDDEGLEVFLRPEFNIESDHDLIKAKSRDIIGNESRPFSAAGKLNEWVYRNIEKKPVISIPSALEVLRTGVGDCNEHAALLTALLRSAGIPAKIVVGLAYTRGKFFYHAWTDAWFDRWISMDATMNQMPVDVTHIKLFEGNLDQQVEIAGLIGTLTLEVLDFQND